MFCPKCSAYLTEREIVKTNVKYAPGNVPIEYEARCPNCRIEMGTVSWGQLTVDPKLAAELAAAPAAPPAGEPEPATNTPDAHGNSTDASAVKSCPHCGKPLPEGF